MLTLSEAATRVDLEKVWRLTYREYLRQRYCRPDASESLQHHPHLDEIPETTVYLAQDQTGTCGTISLTVDGPARLHTDEVFPAETAAVRADCRRRGIRLAASWRIVTCPLCRRASEVLRQLVNAVVVLCMDLNVQTVLFTFHPDHVAAYRRLLGLEVVAGPVHDPLIAAPAVLMRGEASVVMPTWQHWLKRHPVHLEYQCTERCEGRG